MAALDYGSAQSGNNCDGDADVAVVTMVAAQRSSLLLTLFRKACARARCRPSLSQLCSALCSAARYRLTMRAPFY
jgi:hypothetical protein